MKKLFRKILSTSVMSLCCVLSFVSFVRADGPDWLSPKSIEYKLFFKLSKESQAKLINLRKNFVADGKYNRGRTNRLFTNKLKEIDDLETHAPKENDKLILPIVTGYVKKDNVVYTNVSIFKKLTGHCKSGINGIFQKLNCKTLRSSVDVCNSVRSLGLYGTLRDNYAYVRKWSVRIMKIDQPSNNTDSSIPSITPPPQITPAPTQAITIQQSAPVTADPTPSAVVSSTDRDCSSFNFIESVPISVDTLKSYLADPSFSLGSGFGPDVGKQNDTWLSSIQDFWDIGVSTF